LAPVEQPDSRSLRRRSGRGRREYGKPEIMNTDQGNQFTSSAFIGLLQEHSIQVSMDGKGCWREEVAPRSGHFLKAGGCPKRSLTK